MRKKGTQLSDLGKVTCLVKIWILFVAIGLLEPYGVLNAGSPSSIVLSFCVCLQNPQKHMNDVIQSQQLLSFSVKLNPFFLSKTSINRSVRNV